MLAPAAASSLDKPNAIAAQNLLSSSRPATGGRPGEGNGALPERSERRRFHLVIVTPHEALRRPLESALGGWTQRSRHRDYGRVGPSQGRCHCYVGRRSSRG